MRSWLKIMASALLLGTAAPAATQLLNQSDGERLLKAVAEDDGATAVSIVDAPGSRAVNYRGYTGDTALHVVTKRRDLVWVNYLLTRKADPNIGDKQGDTALIIASRIGFAEAVESMIAYKAQIDTTNRLGETALIAAIQHRHPSVVRMLLEAGADPDKADRAAGLSARDYAKRDSRNPELLKLIETVKSTKKKAVSGPKL